MSSQKPEAKPVDNEDTDHSQPINLVAPRAPVPTAAFTGTSSSVATQPVTMRAQLDPPKSGLMTLFFRAPGPRPPGSGQVISPVMGTQVASSQHFSATKAFKNIKSLKVGYYQEKPSEKAPDFKNSNISGWKVIRMPSSDITQSQSNSSAQPVSGTLASGILPAALAGGSARHIVPAAVHPVISASSSGSGPMASIIRSAHHVSQAGHLIHQPYPSHVPRGAAAVASISAAPKSAVATPILRTPHSAGSMTLASSMMASHTPVRARSPTLIAGRTATPPVASTTAHPQVIDLQKSSVTHSLASSPGQISLSNTQRSGVSHPAHAITFAKPINISQPIVQHLQQVSDKSFIKTISGVTSAANTPSNSTPAHQNTGILPNVQVPATDGHSVCVVPSVTRASVSNISSAGTYTGIVQLPTAALPQHVPTLRPSLVQPQTLHSLASSGSVMSGTVTPHQTLTVISAKSLPPNSQSVTLSALPPRTSTPSTTVVSTVGSLITSTSVLTASSTRPLNAINSACPAAIPVAKVYPQPLTQSSQPHSERSENSQGSGGGSAISQTSILGVSTTSISGNTVSTTVTAVTTTTVTTTNCVPSFPQTVVISEKRSDSSTSVRFASLTKPVGGGTSFAVPSAYLYDQYPGAVAVHPYPVNSSSQNFATAIPVSQLRPLTFSQHGNSSMTPTTHPSVCGPASSSASVQPLNSLMVAVDSRHVTLHPSYTTVSVAGGKPSTDSVSQMSSTGATYTVSHSTVSTAPVGSATYSTVQTQGSVANHTSPRPSILRKRTSENLGIIPKKNLLSSLCNSETANPRVDYGASVSIPAGSSPKPSSDHLHENGTSVGSVAISDAEKNRLLLANVASVIKKEPGVHDKSNSANNSEANLKDSCITEASPRKKPRKQLLSANELMETHSSDGEDAFNRDRDTKMNNIEENKSEDESKDVKVTFCKRPSMSLIKSYYYNWNPRHNHFIRYSEVKPKGKEEKRVTVTELANQKNIQDDIQGWKVNYLSAQLIQLIDLEDDVYKKLSYLLKTVENEPPALKSKALNADEKRILNKLTDLIKGNLQRSKIVQEQVEESKQQFLKLLDHKSSITDLLNKYTNKRHQKKKRQDVIIRCLE